MTLYMLFAGLGMPTFAGQLTEEELQALIVYVKSLSVLVQVQRR
jgi:hypothetical protein